MILGYARCSTQEQAADNRTSLSIQENVIRGYAMANGVDKFGVQMYVDIGESGATPIRFREQGSKLLEDVRPGDIIVASKLDRLFRSPSDALNNAEKWNAEGIKLVLYDLGTDPVFESPTAKFFFAVLAAAAGMERDRIAERMKSAKHAKKARGGHTGGLAPYGWKIIGHGHASKLEINPDEQAIADFVRQQAANTSELARIRDAVNGHGYRTRNGRPFQSVQIQRIVEAGKSQ